LDLIILLLNFCYDSQNFFKGFHLNVKSLTIAALAISLFTGCATEHSRAIQAPQTKSSQVIYNGAKQKVSIGKFDNRSSYMRGIFSDGVDRMGSQAKTILASHLQQSGRFDVLDRDNISEIAQESGFSNKKSKILGAKYVLTGDVTEFGRKEIGDHQLFGILGSGKSQIAYSKVTINVIDVANSRVIFSTQGAGEYSLENREVVGFGSTASYDSTLNGKVLDLAIREAVDNLSKAIDAGVIR